jgi:hypothetical protein
MGSVAPMAQKEGTKVGREPTSAPSIRGDCGGVQVLLRCLSISVITVAANFRGP